MMTSSTTTTTSSPSMATSTSTSKTSKFNLQGKRFFLTFPQCPVAPELAQERLKEKYGDSLKWYLLAQELHQDGEKHLHIGLEMKETFRTKRSDVFDFIGEKHGNYQTMKNMRKCVEYITKGGVFLACGIDVDAVKKKQNGATLSVAQAVVNGKSLEELNQEFPGFVMMNKRKIEDYISWIQRQNLKKQKQIWNEFPAGDIMDMDNISDRQIAIWLNENIRKPRKFKQKNLYIWGPPNMGKSSLITRLSQYLSIYVIPRDEDFYDGFENDVFDLAVLDEAKSTKTMQWLNQWLDGQVMTLRQKGKQYVKTQNIPTIILSNYKIEDNYKKLYEKNELGPLITRLMFVEVTSFITLWGVEEEEREEALLQEKDQM